MWLAVAEKRSCAAASSRFADFAHEFVPRSTAFPEESRIFPSETYSVTGPFWMPVTVMPSMRCCPRPSVVSRTTGPQSALRRRSAETASPPNVACQARSSRKTSSVRVMFAVFSPDCMADSTASGISASSAAPCRGVSVRLRAVFASSESAISKTRFSSVLSCSASDMETSRNAPASSAMDGSKIAASFCASSPEITAE